MNKNKLRELLADQLRPELLSDRDRPSYAIAAALLAVSDSIDDLASSVDGLKEEADEGFDHLGVKLSEVKESVDVVGNAVNDLEINR